MRKFIMAAFMLLVATVMLTSSTYAWFAMSTQVTVTGLQMIAKSDETYLLIGTGDRDTAAEMFIFQKSTSSCPPSSSRHHSQS